MSPPKQSANDLVARITECVRAADKAFESSGGSSRHWVRECLLPHLEDSRLAIVDTLVPIHAASAERDVNSLAAKLDNSDRLVATLFEALKSLQRVSFHLSNCPAYPPGCMMESCVCGFDDAEEQARAAIASVPADLRAAIEKARTR